jgi:RHS repeat-associated protein
LNTIRDLVDNSGAIIDHIDYTAFGTILSQTNAGVADRFIAFAGLQHDSATNLDLSQSRPYNASSGRWSQQDWIDFRGGDQNLYRYVGNNPSNGTDPAGTNPILTGIIGGVIGGIAGGISSDWQWSAIIGGFVGGAVTGILVGVGVPPCPAGFIGGAYSSVVSQMINGGDMSLTSIFISALTGALATGLGAYGFGKAAGVSPYQDLATLTRAELERVIAAEVFGTSLGAAVDGYTSSFANELAHELGLASLQQTQSLINQAQLCTVTNVVNDKSFWSSAIAALEWLDNITPGGKAVDIKWVPSNPSRSPKSQNP